MATGTRSRLLGPVKAIEDAWQVNGTNADSGVGDAENCVYHYCGS
jgi:hypothetical protein